MLTNMAITDGPAVSARIRSAIRRAHRRQTGVATMCGLSWPQWQRRMRGTTPWRLDEVQCIARELGLSLDDLVGEDGA